MPGCEGDLDRAFGIDFCARPASLDGQVFRFKDYTHTPPPTPPAPGACIPDLVDCVCASEKQAPKSGLADGDGKCCRNPDGKPAAWCYTENLMKRWESCDVQTCDTA